MSHVMPHVMSPMVEGVLCIQIGDFEGDDVVCVECRGE